MNRRQNVNVIHIILFRPSRIKSPCDYEIRIHKNHRKRSIKIVIRCDPGNGEGTKKSWPEVLK